MNKAMGVLAGFALLVSLGTAHAVVLDDPLHGACPGCTSQQVDGSQNVTVLGPGGVTGFGFTSSPAGNTGALQLEFLIPNSFSLTAVQLFAGLVTVTSTTGPNSGLTLFSTTAWTSGDLTGYLSIAAAPPNPLNAWLPATQTVQPTATGYYVLFADMGQYTLQGQSDPLADIFSLSPAIFANGGFITAFLLDATDKQGDEIGNVSTAQSSALFYSGVSGRPFCANPNGCDESSLERQFPEPSGCSVVALVWSPC